MTINPDIPALPFANPEFSQMAKDVSSIVVKLGGFKSTYDLIFKKPDKEKIEALRAELQKKKITLKQFKEFLKIGHSVLNVVDVALNPVFPRLRKAVVDRMPRLPHFSELPKGATLEKIPPFKKVHQAFTKGLEAYEAFKSYRSIPSGSPYKDIREQQTRLLIASVDVLSVLATYGMAPASPVLSGLGNILKATTWLKKNKYLEFIPKPVGKAIEVLVGSGRELNTEALGKMKSEAAALLEGILNSPDVLLQAKKKIESAENESELFSIVEKMLRDHLGPLQDEVAQLLPMQSDGFIQFRFGGLIAETLRQGELILKRYKPGADYEWMKQTIYQFREYERESGPIAFISDEIRKKLIDIGLQLELFSDAEEINTVLEDILNFATPILPVEGPEPLEPFQEQFASGYTDLEALEALIVKAARIIEQREDALKLIPGFVDAISKKVKKIHFLPGQLSSKGAQQWKSVADFAVKKERTLRMSSSEPRHDVEMPSGAQATMPRAVGKKRKELEAPPPDLSAGKMGKKQKGAGPTLRLGIRTSPESQLGHKSTLRLGIRTSPDSLDPEQ